jgi:hypothetical protein
VKPAQVARANQGARVPREAFIHQIANEIFDGYFTHSGFVSLSGVLETLQFDE